MNAPLPSLFISHGSPMIALQPGPAGLFLQGLGRAIDNRWGRPRAVLALSPHTATRVPLLLAAARHEAVHDFGGFPQALFELRYDAPGAPALAQRAAALLKGAGLPAQVVPEGGLDHGIWTVLRHMWPQADVPVLPLSLVPQWGPQQLWSLGQALAPLAGEGVLLLGSGSLTHNLQLFFGGAHTPQDEADCRAFAAWVAERVAAADTAALLGYRHLAPAAARMHPSDEHWLPFYLAAGAADAAGSTGPGWQGRRLHASVDHGVLAMDVYAFGPGAEALTATPSRS